MRLTLRTLLAYIDNILEPADAQEIAKKVEESEFATNLMHRMRDVSRRLRLGAPKLDGRGMALDPNTVAEYLDNTLASERVPEFEKICLESDMHLAEVASVHQILTLVLGEPAEIDTELRERMYRLGSQDAPSITAGRPSDTPLPSRTPMPSTAATRTEPEPVQRAPVERPAAARNKPEVPDYLREPPRVKGSGARMLVAALLMIVVGAAVVVVLNVERFQERLGIAPREQVAVETPRTSESTGVADSTSTKAAPSSPTSLEQPPTATTQTPITGSTSASGSPEAGPAPLPPDRTAATGSTPQPGSAAPAGGPMPEVSPSVLPGTVPPGSLPVAPGPAGTVPSVAGTTTPGTTATAPVPMSGPDVASGAPPGPALSSGPSTVPPGPAPAVPGNPALPPGPVGVGPAPGPAIASAAPGSAASGGPAPVVAKTGPAEEVGRFMEGDLLLRFTANDDRWHRVPMRATVFSNDRVMTLPTFRCAMTLATGMSVDLLGGTEVSLGPPDAQGVPEVNIMDGRIVLLSAGAPTAVVNIGAANRRGVLVLGDTNASAALQVRHQHIEGTNPEKQPSAVEFDLFVTTGKVEWLDANATQPETIVAPARRVLIGDVVGPASNEPPTFPSWVTVFDERRQSQKLASAELSKALPTDRPVTLVLKELASDRKIETSLLAIQSLAQIGDFDTLVTALKDPNQKAAWNEEVDSLRLAIARSSETAAAVRLAFERHFGVRAAELYRMLWGYTAEQINAGAGAQLVKFLDAEDLEYRVLAFAALTRITNGATHFYRPEFTAAKRQPYILKWKQRLDSGQLVPKTPATP